MKIQEMYNDCTQFDNGKTITFDHIQDCCEYNYADFSQLEELALNTNFSEPLDFEEVENAGFRFGNRPNKMFFVPCYSSQNGYYTTLLDIYYNGLLVLDGIDCRMELD